MRTDGDMTIYQIEHQAPITASGRPGEWQRSGYVDTIESDRHLGTWRNCNSFSACGDVWQQQGEHGTYDLDYAREIMEAVHRLCPGLTLRIVERRFLRATEVIIIRMPRKTDETMVKDAT